MHACVWPMGRPGPALHPQIVHYTLEFGVLGLLARPKPDFHFESVFSVFLETFTLSVFSGYFEKPSI